MLYKPIVELMDNEKRTTMIQKAGVPISRRMLSSVGASPEKSLPGARRKKTSPRQTELAPIRMRISCQRQKRRRPSTINGAEMNASVGANS